MIQTMCSLCVIPGGLIPYLYIKLSDSDVMVIGLAKTKSDQLIDLEKQIEIMGMDSKWISESSDLLRVYLPCSGPSIEVSFDKALREDSEAEVLTFYWKSFPRDPVEHAEYLVNLGTRMELVNGLFVQKGFSPVRVVKEPKGSLNRFRERCTNVFYSKPTPDIDTRNQVIADCNDIANTLSESYKK